MKNLIPFWSNDYEFRIAKLTSESAARHRPGALSVSWLLKQKKLSDSGRSSEMIKSHTDELGRLVPSRPAWRARKRFFEIQLNLISNYKRERKMFDWYLLWLVKVDSELDLCEFADRLRRIEELQIELLANFGTCSELHKNTVLKYLKRLPFSPSFFSSFEIHLFKASRFGLSFLCCQIFCCSPLSSFPC